MMERTSLLSTDDPSSSSSQQDPGGGGRGGGGGGGSSGVGDAGRGSRSAIAIPFPKQKRSTYCNWFVLFFAVLVGLTAVGIVVYSVLFPHNHHPVVVVLANPSKGQGDRPYGPKWSSRSPVYAQNGMAATSHPLVTQVAIDILKKGGSAVDAAIAADALLGLVEPTGSGIGGDLMAMVWNPIERRLYALNAGGRSSKSISFERMKSYLNGSSTIPAFGPYPINVPGCVDGWFSLRDKFSAFSNLTMSDLLNPAIQYARLGFPLSQITSAEWKVNVNRLKASSNLIPHFSNFLKTYTIDGTNPPGEGVIFKNPNLANTLETIAKEGRDSFYKGTLTNTMVSFFKQIGCCLTEEDFNEHFSTWEDPLNTTYKDYTIHEMWPNTQGVATLQILNILENFNMARYEHNSWEYLHLSIEAKKLAFADRAKFYADPAFYNATAEVMARLISKDYARERALLIKLNSTLPSVPAGNPNLGQGDTVYLTTADSSGMMVSFIQSNYRGMGSGVVANDLGFCFQNRGQLFAMNQSYANAYAPGKRPFHTIIPAFVTKDGMPVMSFGVMGGDMQPQGHTQILLNMIDYGMDVQAAGDAARWYHYGDSEPTGEIMTDGGVVALESGIDPVTIQKLISIGHKVNLNATDVYGGYQAIYYDSTQKVYRGASEMRKDGQVAGY